MLDLITEFIGTFIFISVVISAGQAIPIGLTLAAVILFGTGISATHFNPAISTTMLIAGKMSVESWIGYVIAQILGGLCALLFFNYSPIGKKLMKK